MERDQVAKELAEEIRTNTKLRHRLGMSEGASSGLLNEDGGDGPANVIGIATDEGEHFFLEVQEG
jgi:hypothetical protein